MAIGNGARDEKFGQLDQVIAQWKDVPGGLLPIMQHRCSFARFSIVKFMKSFSIFLLPALFAF